jgi:predicted DNA-binding transcriptional regulator AlpA
MSESLFVDGRTAARLIGVSYSTWRRLAESGEVPNSVRIRTGVFWYRPAILAWAEQVAGSRAGRILRAGPRRFPRSCVVCVSLKG